jgi:uncharacterized repeat protein (TIGR01451 family)
MGATAGVNTWTGVGPEGGMLFQVLFSPGAPDTVYARSPTTLYRSMNSGGTWQRITAPGDFQSPLDIAIEGAAPNRLYVSALTSAGNSRLYFSDDEGATLTRLTTFFNTVDPQLIEVSPDGQVIYVSSGGRIFRSGDRGATWVERTAVGPGGLGRDIRILQIDPADQDTLYATLSISDTTLGLFLSEDGAMTWTKVQDIDSPRFVQDLAVTPNPRRLWMALGDNVYVSSDQGRHINPVSFSSAFGGAAALAIAVDPDPSHADRLYASDGFGRLFRSDDAGLHWVIVSDSIHVSQIYRIVRHPTRSLEIFAVGNSDVARTTDGGLTWAPRHSGIVASTVPALSANPARDRIYLASSVGGVHYIESGANAVEVNNDALRAMLSPFATYDVRALLAQEGTPGRLFASLGQTVLRSPDAGNTWVDLNYPGNGSGNDISSLASSPKAPNVLFASTATSGAIRSTNSGDTWSPINVGLPSGASMGIVVAAPSEAGVFYGAPYETVSNGPATFHGVYRWNNGASQWEPANAGFASTLIQDVTVDPFDAHVVYAASDVDGLMKSVNGGDSWTVLPWDTLTGLGKPIRVAVDPTDSRIVYAASNGLIARSVTGGTSWETLRKPSDGPTWGPAALIVDPVDPSTLVLGTGLNGVQRFTVAPDLSLQMSTQANPVASGAPLTYDVSALNLGPFHATNVQVSLQFPASSTDVSFEPAASCVKASSSVTCSFDVLRAGLSSPVTLHLTPGGTGPYQVVASISGVQSDPDASNNSITRSTTVAMLSDLSVTATGTASAQVGAAVTYTVAVSNGGPNPAMAAHLNYTLPSGITPGTVNSTKGTCSTAAAVITCDLGDLAKSDSATVTINGTAATAGAQASTATVSSGSTEAATNNDTATATTTVTAPPPPPSSGGGNSGSSGGGGGGALSPGMLLWLALLAVAQRSRVLRRRRVSA